MRQSLERQYFLVASIVQFLQPLRHSLWKYAKSSRNHPTPRAFHPGQRHWQTWYPDGSIPASVDTPRLRPAAGQTARLAPRSRWIADPNRIVNHPAQTWQRIGWDQRAKVRWELVLILRCFRPIPGWISLEIPHWLRRGVRYGDGRAGTGLRAHCENLPKKR